MPDVKLPRYLMDSDGNGEDFNVIDTESNRVVVSGLNSEQAGVIADELNNVHDAMEAAQSCLESKPANAKRPVETGKELRFASISSAVAVVDGDTEVVLFGLTTEGETYEYMNERRRMRGRYPPLNRDGDENLYTIPGYWKKHRPFTSSVPVLTHTLDTNRRTTRTATPEEQEAFAREGIVIDGEMGE